jgi:hypothetical protein
MTDEEFLDDLETRLNILRNVGVELESYNRLLSIIKDLKNELYNVQHCEEINDYEGKYT